MPECDAKHGGLDQRCRRSARKDGHATGEFQINSDVAAVGGALVNLNADDIIVRDEQRGIEIGGCDDDRLFSGAEAGGSNGEVVDGGRQACSRGTSPLR